MLAGVNARVGPRAWLRSLAALLLATALADCAAQARPTTAPAAAAQPPVVHDLRTLADLTALFDRDREHPRVVLLLSPT
jgi:hypothetical protein